MYTEILNNSKILTTDEINALLEQAHFGNQDAREILIKNNLKLIYSIAKNFNFFNLTHDDLIEYGIIGLINAIDTYNKSFECPFPVYATIIIRRKILLAIKKYHGIIKIPVNLNPTFLKLKTLDNEWYFNRQQILTDQELQNLYNSLNPDNMISLKTTKSLRKLFLEIVHLNISQYEYESSYENNNFNKGYHILENDTIDFQNQIINEITYEKIIHILDGTILSSLTEKERFVLSNVYGFFDDNPKSYQQIANLLGISKNRVYVIFKNAFLKIKIILLQQKIITREEYEKSTNI